MDPIAEYRAWLESRNLAARTVELYTAAVRKMAEIYPDPETMPQGALFDLGGAMMSEGRVNRGTVDIALTGIRQWAGWLRERGRKIGPLDSPPKGYWAAPPPVAAPEPEAQTPAEPAPSPGAPVDPEVAAVKRVLASAARAEVRRQNGHGQAGANGKNTITASGLLPAMSTIEVWQRSPDTGKMVQRKLYNARDINGSGSIEDFLRKWVCPKYPKSSDQGWEFVIVEIMPSGQRRAEYPVEIPSDESEDDVSSAANAVAGEVRKLREDLDVEKQVERVTKIGEAIRGMQGDGAGPDPMAFAMEMMRMKQMMRMMAEMMREMDPPPAAPPSLTSTGPDPILVELRAELRETKAEIARLREGGGMKDIAALAGVFQAPWIEILKSDRTKAKGGVGEVVETLTALKSIGIKVGGLAGDDSGELVKLSTNVVEAIKLITAVKNPAATPAAPAEVRLPAGFKEKLATLKDAPDARHRIAIGAEAIEMLAKSGDARFIQFLVKLRELAIVAVSAPDDAKRTATYGQMMEMIEPIIVAFSTDGHIDVGTRDLTVQAYRENIALLSVLMAQVPEAPGAAAQSAAA